VLQTDDNHSATNSADVITVLSGYLVTKLSIIYTCFLTDPGIIIIIIIIITAIGLSPGGSSPTLIQTKIKIRQNNENNYKKHKKHKTTK
jgi:hypothetical protein